ncbi:MAG: hypothetical protein JWM80_2304 [Cyanobacteria bacterium RYN_339]|nr:hypothetical protein [Cyanobacteria bacterium RYN_339]
MEVTTIKQSSTNATGAPVQAVAAQGVGKANLRDTFSFSSVRQGVAKLEKKGEVMLSKPIQQLKEVVNSVLSFFSLDILRQNNDRIREERRHELEKAEEAHYTVRDEAANYERLRALRLKEANRLQTLKAA